MDQENKQPTYPENYQRITGYCAKCGAPLQENAMFCSQCGSMVGRGQMAELYAAPPVRDDRSFAAVYAPPEYFGHPAPVYAAPPKRSFLQKLFGRKH